jgi:hypothetical protein
MNNEPKAMVVRSVARTMASASTAEPTLFETLAKCSLVMRAASLTVPPKLDELCVLPQGCEADSAGDETEDDGPEDFFVHVGWWLNGSLLVV